MVLVTTIYQRLQVASTVGFRWANSFQNIGEK